MIEEGYDDDGDTDHGKDATETLVGESTSQAPAVPPPAPALTPPLASPPPRRRTKLAKDRPNLQPSSTILALSPPISTTIAALSPSSKHKQSQASEDHPFSDP